MSATLERTKILNSEGQAGWRWGEVGGGGVLVSIIHLCTTIIISFFTLCIFLVLYFFCTAHVYIPIWYFKFDSKNTYIFVRNKFQSNKLVNFYWSRALKSFNSSSVASGLKKFGRTSQVVHPNFCQTGSYRRASISLCGSKKVHTARSKKKSTSNLRLITR